MKTIFFIFVVTILCCSSYAHSTCTKEDKLKMIRGGWTKAEIDDFCNGSGPGEEQEPVEQEQASPQEQNIGMFCCDAFGNRRCGGNMTLPLGSSCFCPGQGYGIVCR